VRESSERRGEIARVDAITDALGRVQPVHRSRVDDIAESNPTFEPIACRDPARDITMPESLQMFRAARALRDDRTLLTARDWDYVRRTRDILVELLEIG